MASSRALNASSRSWTWRRSLTGQGLEHDPGEEVADLLVPAAAVDEAVIVDPDQLAMLAQQHRQMLLHQTVEPAAGALDGAQPDHAPERQDHEQ